MILVSGGLAILCGSTITNHEIQKLYPASPAPLNEEKELSSGPLGINEKDINDMVLSGHDVQSVIESNTYSGLEAKLKFNTWKKI